MKTSPLLLFTLFALLLCMQCECEQSTGTAECPDESHGDFFIAISAIEAAEPFLCPSANLPNNDLWQNNELFTGDVKETDKYYIKLRIDGFCDNIGKTEPFTVVLNGVDNLSIQPAIVNGQRGFRILDVPIDRQLTLSLSMREPCQESPCSFCVGQTGGSPDYRMRFIGMKTEMRVIDLDAVSMTLFGVETRCDCTP